MFSVRPLCRLVIMAAVVVVLVGVNFVLKDSTAVALSLAAAVWRWFYISSLKIKITSVALIRSSGNVFKHKTVVLLKNIFYMQTLVVAPCLPAVVRIHSRGNRMFIIGLDGYQLAFLEKAVENNMG